MKKKGFTLVEVMAVLSITSLLIIMVGGIYVSGMKVINKTKANTDIENEYRRTYNELNRLLNNSSGIEMVEKPLNIRNSNKRFLNSLFIYKKQNKTYILGEANCNKNTFSLYNIEVEKFYSNDDIIDIDSKNEFEISSHIKSINFSKSKLANDNFIDCEVKFKVLNSEEDYTFNIDTSSGKAINLYLEDKNAGYTEWKNAPMTFANFNVLNKGNISMGLNGEIDNCTFNVNGYRIQDILKNIKFNKNNIIALNSPVFNSIPDFAGDEPSTELEVNVLNDAINNMNNQTFYIVKNGDYGEFLREKPSDVSKIVGILKLIDGQKLMIIDGNIDFVANDINSNNDIFYLDNIVVISNGDIKFTNCPISSKSGIFELIANNNIIINNTTAKVNIEGDSNQSLDYYFNKKLMKENIDAFQKLKNGLKQINI